MTAATARAQAPLTSGAWLLSPAIGLAFDPDAEVSLAVAGGAAYPLTSSVAIEGELGHLFDLAPDDPTVDTSLTTVHGGLLYFFTTPYALTPYVVGGIGVGHFSRDTDRPAGDLEQTEVGFNLGGGVTYPIRDQLWIRGDFRYLKHIDNIPSAWRLLAGVSIRLE